MNSIYVLPILMHCTFNPFTDISLKQYVTCSNDRHNDLRPVKPLSVVKSSNPLGPPSSSLQETKQIAAVRNSLPASHTESLLAMCDYLLEYMGVALQPGRGGWGGRGIAI